MTANDEAGSALEGNLTRTADNYDAVPYDSRPIFRAHPARLAAMAHLFGIDAPDPAAARVLELGCAAGGNLIPMAMFNPGMRCVGIDIGKRQIEDGQRRVAEAGLTNVELIHGSITEIGPDLGEFDYIVTHGVYSWVPHEVREAILAVCKRHLSPDGIAFVSYNVLPGWRMLQPLRDALRIMVPSGLSEVERGRMGRQVLEYIAATTPNVGPYSDMIRTTRDRVAGFTDSYLFHEYMEDVNEPQTFSGFMSDAARHGLGYLGESELTDMMPERHGEQFAETLARNSPDNIIDFEQLLDVLTGNPFRTTLLIHDNRLEQVNRSFTPERLAGLHFLPAYILQYREEGSSVVLSGPTLGERRYEEPLVVLLLRRLFNDAPASRTFPELVEGLGPEDAQASIVVLKNMLVGGAITISTLPMHSEMAGEFPVANPLARADAAAGRPETASRLHVGVGFGDMSPLLVARLDGSMDRAAIENFVREGFLAGKIDVRNEDGEKPEPHELDQAVRTYVNAGLRSISGHGLIDA